MATTGKTSGKSTVSDEPVLLFTIKKQGGNADFIVIHNDDASTADGHWMIGLAGESKILDAGTVISLPLQLNQGEIYIQRKAGGANLTNVRGYTLP